MILVFVTASLIVTSLGVLGAAFMFIFFLVQVVVKVVFKVTKGFVTHRFVMLAFLSLLLVLLRFLLLFGRFFLLIAFLLGARLVAALPLLNLFLGAVFLDALLFFAVALLLLFLALSPVVVVFVSRVLHLWCFLLVDVPSIFLIIFIISFVIAR